MNLADDLIQLLRCPITKQPLGKASRALIDRANGLIHGGELTNRLGEAITDSIDDGLIDQGGTWLYAIRDGIVCLLAEEAISLDRLELEDREADA